MMDKLWVVLLVALTGAHLGHGLPVRSTPHSYPHNTNGPVPEGWQGSNLYAAVPALALLVTAVGLLIGCTWCYRHKDCKQNEGADNQLFTASATHLHERRSHPPDSGFSEPANNNISEDNNNGPISLREMQNIANNNAAAYIVSENEERNRVSRESVVEFEPLPTGIRVADPLERCVDWFGDEDFPRNRLQYLREIGRGWFGRIVEGEIENDGTTTTVAVKILNQNASLEDKARFLDEARLYRDASHDHVLAFVASCLQEDPWILIFELCSTDLQTYLTMSRANMAELNESGVPLRLMCDVTSALAYLHSRGHAYGYICASNVLVRGEGLAARAVLGHYGAEPRPLPPDRDASAPPKASSDVQWLGTLLWEICAWGAPPPRAPPPDLNCPYGDHLYQVMQLCWTASAGARPTAAQVHALLEHLHTTHARSHGPARDDGYGSSDFEERWQRLKPNTIPKLDEHVAIVHAPSTSMTSRFTGSEEFDHPAARESLGVDVDAAVSRSSSIMSDRDALSVQIRSESLNNLHGSLDDVRNIYLTHNETAVLDCHQANVALEDREREHDRSDASVDPWLKDIIAGSQDDVSYYRDVSDVIKNLDNILNSEKTSSSESSHQASPSRDNLSLDCKKDYPMQSSMVKSPGITNFQNILEIGFEDRSPEKKRDEEEDRDTIGTLSHSFERHSDTISQQTLENLTPDTPVKDLDLPCEEITDADLQDMLLTVEKTKVEVDAELPKENKIENSYSVLPNLTDLCIRQMSSVNEASSEVSMSEDCQSPGDNNLADIVSDKETVEAKSISEIINDPMKSESVEEIIARNIQSLEQSSPVNVQNKEVLPIVSEIVENDKIEVLLPSNTLDDKNVTDTQPELSSLNSQCEINNDLNTPAESTINSKITQVESVPLVAESAASITNNVSEVSDKPAHIIEEETEQGKLPLALNEKGEESLPVKVQNKTLYAAGPDLYASPVGSEIEKNEIISVPITVSKIEATKTTPEELVIYLDTQNENEKSNVLSHLETPKLVLSKSQDDIQTMPILDRVPEELVERIIKEAETAALNSIETAHVNLGTPAPVNIPKTKESSVNTFLENEIIAIESDFEHNRVIMPEVIPDVLKETIFTAATSHGAFLKEELKKSQKDTPIVGNCDKIAKGILIEALQDVPKAIDIVKTPEIIPDNDVKDLEIEINLAKLDTVPTKMLPEIVQDAEKPVEPIVTQNRDQSDISRQEIALAQSVDPQKSLDLESTASADSSQSTFLIKDTLNEGCSTVLAKESEQILLEKSEHHYAEPEIRAGPAFAIKDTPKDEITTVLTDNSDPILLEESVQYNSEPEIKAENISMFPTNDIKMEETTLLEGEAKPKEQILLEKDEESIQIEKVIAVEDITHQNALLRSDSNKAEAKAAELSNNSTAYMDFTDDIKGQILEQNPMADNVKDVINSCFETSTTESVCSLVKNESTVYLDLPNVIRQMDDFLHSERQLSSYVDAKDPLCSSTPKSSTDDTQKSDPEKSDVLSETKVPDYGPGVTLTRLEQQCVPDSMSPFESPTKSHPTDTYDENSSVVLGPFENCTMELFKGVKSATDLVEIPKEELLAFSSNFSEINLETPSPLRDGNFLNEVPDIIQEGVNFDDITSEPKDETDPKTDVSDPTDQSVTEKRVSPSTPPNSPGYFLASTSQQKYLVDIDLNQPTEPVVFESDSGLSSLHKEIELNQIELQITSKLAMAENENNLNIEYSGPLTVEGLVQDDLQREEESVPETFLAGNGGCIENMREGFTLDEDSIMYALRNELELKLPLAQVAAIEPQCESESEVEGDGSWSGELPPPPELIVSYPGALSPIAEETAPQLSAYENDAQWNTSVRTDSSESYPEPCNNSTDEVTELATGLASARDAPTRDDTYTVQRDASREITMSADSLNGSPRKSDAIDDRTFTKTDKEEVDGCERLSQVSPFVLSPATDTAAPDASDVTAVSTLSRPTAPSDADASRPTETRCLSKATSIDSWCSNDTLYNVEEAFDDLASDPDLPADLDKDLDDSESSHTLTVNDDKELSHVSTYIVHDSRSDEDRFSPDSITANEIENHTYTKAKTEVETSPSVLTKSEVHDQTKDLAYGTLMSGAPSYSNCTTEMLSADNAWMFSQPELVRRSPLDAAADVSAPANTGTRDVEPDDSPQLKDEPRLKKMDSVDISCLEDHLLESSPENHGSVRTGIHDSPNYHYDIAATVTSTPLTEPPPNENVEPVPMTLPEEERTPENLPNNIPNFQSFLFSAELRPQERSYAPTDGSRTKVLLEGDSTQNTASPSYWEFENAVAFKPQDTSRMQQSSQNGSEEFRQFENSVRERPQDLSTTPSALLQLSERHSSDNERSSPPVTRAEPTSLVISPPSITNLRESHVGNVNTIIITDLEEDDTEQPHSIIIAEVSKDSPNRTYDSHTAGELNHTYDSHPSRRQNDNHIKESNSDHSKELTVNGFDDQSHNAEHFEFKSPEAKTAEEPKQKEQTLVNDTNTPRDVPNGSVSNLVHINSTCDIKCNGNSEKFATVNFISEAFEELLESNVDDGDCKDKTNNEEILELSKEEKNLPSKEIVETPAVNPEVSLETGVNGVEEKLVAVTEDFLQNEKKFCQLDAYLPLLSDIRFTGPASEIMSTSFTQDSPTEPEPEREEKPGADMKEWDSDSDSHSSNSSSGEFIWKGGDGQETSVVPSTHFDHRGSSDGSRGSARAGGAARDSGSGSGSEGDEVEFVPSSWDCRAAPAKSSLRSLANSQDSKKRVVFKRQKYHCVYEYPRELSSCDADSPAYLPDLSTYTDWDPSSAEEAELGYGQLFAPAPLDMYPLRGTIAFGAEYDEDFFISSSARPFESLGVMTTTSQFFPGMQLKPGLLADLPDAFPAPPAPRPAPALTPALAPTRTPSLDFTTPDSGVEDITPGSTSTEDDFKSDGPPEADVGRWRAGDGGSSSESVSPSSPGGEALGVGGLRHTRDKLKLDLPPSPHAPSPRHARAFSFVLDKPRRARAPEPGATPLVMTDDTPLVSSSLPLPEACEEPPAPEPTFSTFGKCAQKTDPDQKIILTDDVRPEQGGDETAASPVKVEAKGEGTVLDSGDEDSGIESSSKATLERNKAPNVS